MEQVGNNLNLPDLGNTQTYTSEHDCERCADTHWIEFDDAEGVTRAARCSCHEAAMHRLKVEKLFASAAIPKRFQGKSFANFDVSWQPKAYEISKSYMETWSEHVNGEGLFLVGPVGTGKSHLAFAVLNGLVKRGVPGMAATVPDLMDELRPNEAQNHNKKVEVLKTIDLLVLDDLGAQKSTEWVTERLFIILNARYAAMLPTVITSNNYLEELEKVPGWTRIIDRIVETSRIIRLEGDSYRRESRRKR